MYDQKILKPEHNTVQIPKLQEEEFGKINTEKFLSFGGKNFNVNQIQADAKNGKQTTKYDKTLVFDEERFFKITGNIQKKFPIHNDLILPIFMRSLVFAEIGKSLTMSQSINQDLEVLTLISDQYNDKSNECAAASRKLYESVKSLDKSIDKTNNLIRKMSKKKYSFFEAILIGITWIVYLIPNTIKFIMEKLNRKQKNETNYSN